MIAYQTVSVRVENVGEQNAKVSHKGGEGEDGKAMYPMWRRREGDDGSNLHSTLAASLP
jgi:hypothetical protein